MSYLSVGEGFSKFINNTLCAYSVYRDEGFEINYIDVSKKDPSKLSYLDEKREAKVYEENGNLYNPKYRYHGRPGKVLKKIWPTISNKHIDQVCAILKAEYSSKVDIQIVKGDAIKDAYYARNYKKSNGSQLWNSCMRYRQCLDFLEIYTKNSQVSCMVAKDEEGKIVGRAIIWLDKILDRIYHYDECTKYKMQKYAEENGFTTCHESNDMLELDYPDIIKLDETDFEYYPYMDTFKLLSLNRKFVADEESEYNYRFYLDKTNGGPRNSHPYMDHYWSEHNQEYIEEGYQTYISRYNDYFFESQTVIVGDKRYLKTDDEICKDYRDRWRLKQDCKFSQLLDQFIPFEKAIFSDDDWIPIELTVFCEFDAKRVLKDNAIWSNRLITYIPTTNLTEINGEIYHTLCEAELIGELQTT